MLLASLVGVVTKSKLWGPPEKELDDKRVDQAIGQGMKESSGGNEKTGSGKPGKDKACGDEDER